jgi:hypothetical protein
VERISKSVSSQWSKESAILGTVVWAIF